MGDLVVMEIEGSQLTILYDEDYFAGRAEHSGVNKALELLVDCLFQYLGKDAVHECLKRKDMTYSFVAGRSANGTVVRKEA